MLHFPLCIDTSSIYDPLVIQSAFVRLWLPSNIENSGARTTSYIAQLFELLDGVGYENFWDDNPKQMVQLLLWRMQHPTLKSKMFQRVTYNTFFEILFLSS